MYRLIIKPQVYIMLDEAYDWYEHELVGLGERLLDEVDARLENLRQNPLYYSYTSDNFRQVLLRHFPYKIVFEVINNEVIVYAIFHTSRGDVKLK